MLPAICDCHVHVFDPRRFAYATPRRFTPGEATVEQLQAHMRTVGAARVVLVQPSVYGEKNACMLDALSVLDGRARGVAVVSRNTTGDEIARLDAAGVCGARLNLVVDHLVEPALALRKLIEIEDRLPSAWHVQLHVSQEVLCGLTHHMVQSPRIYVLDHMGLPDVGLGTHARGWSELLRLMRGGRLYVKLSAPYLYSRAGPPYDDLTPLAKSLLTTRADRVLWGSNWPHTQGTGRNPTAGMDTVEAFRKVDDLAWLAACRLWFASDVPSMLSDNAARLYEFSGSRGTDGQVNP